MHPAITGTLVDNADLGVGTESSFPERHFMLYSDEEVCLTDTDLAGAQSASGKLQMLEPGHTLLWSQPEGWASRAQQLRHRSPMPYYEPQPNNTVFSNQSSQATPPAHTESTLFREQSPTGLLWHSLPPDSNPEEDSDSIQSPNETLEEFCPPLPTGPSAPGQTHHTSHTSVTSSSTNWLDFSAAAAPSLARPNYDNTVAAADAGEAEMAFQRSSSPSKVDSKRIAHKLSEKSRRNRLTIAIREIQKLLPPALADVAETGDHSRSHSRAQPEFHLRPGVPSSKLDVVETAVGFIKDLKKKNLEMARRVREAERKLGECRCREAGEASGTPEATVEYLE